MTYGPVVPKPLLSAKHIQNRLDFAEANIDRDWSNVIFSDEATFACFEYKKML